ncbi:MAG TPA: hypothetical protein PK156_01150 [Polyangium sp.]|nr:hypothetical protein [Polyangium sp.]
MKSLLYFSLSAAVFVLSACGDRDATSGSSAPALVASDSAKNVPVHSKVAPRREGKLRSANEMRVALVVLPGDARVEIDGEVTERRDGLVDLEGKLGDVRRVRVWKGERATEKSIMIAENGATPAVIDLNAPGPVEPTNNTRKKSSPVQFGFDE